MRFITQDFLGGRVSQRRGIAKHPEIPGVARAGAQWLAAGRTNVACAGMGRNDEIGTMASAVEVFRQAAISNQALEAEAQQARHQAEADFASSSRSE